MSTTSVRSLPWHVQAATAQFRADVVRGLGAANKELPCKYFYDEIGSELFERITELPEYYLTRAELSIMRRHAADMAQCLGRGCLLIEYGSGSSTKTRLLLDHLDEPAGYVAMDVSREHLHLSTRRLASEYPHVEVLPLCADFTGSFELPRPQERPSRRAVYFPGSTIGNLTPEQAARLLHQTARLCGPEGGLLLGADLRKNPRTLEAAYNDRQGVTAAFNRNILVRINRELKADFEVEQFTHRAIYDAPPGRIEMQLVSRRPQVIHIGEREFFIAAGEAIRTEYSHKYTLRQLSAMAEDAGFQVEQLWMDPSLYFSVHYLAVRS